MYLQKHWKTADLTRSWWANIRTFPQVGPRRSPRVESCRREYYRSYDPFVALTAAALATSKLLIGPGVLLLPQRDAIHTAKAVSSLDQISAGRLLLGLGLGWNLEEAADHGVEAAMRGKLLDEKLAAMKELWGNEEAEFTATSFRCHLLLAQARAEATSEDLLRRLHRGHHIPSTTASRWVDAHGRLGRGHGPGTAEPSRRCNRHSSQRHCPRKPRTRAPGRLRQGWRGTSVHPPSTKPESETLQLVDSMAALTETYS
jgi:hypothetical protein